MSILLLIEDEIALRTTMARALSEIEGLTVVEAGTVSAGIAAIQLHNPAVILSDLDLPDGSGIELLAVLDRLKLPARVVFASAYLSSYRDQIPQRQNVTLKEKPLPLEELRQVVRAQLEVGPAEVGLPFTVEEWVQLACMGRHSISLDLSLGAEPRGSIVVRAGEVWAAEDRTGVGEEAFRRLTFDRSLSVACRTLRSEPGPRNIDRPWVNLLLESARVLDEENRLGGHLDEAAVSDSELATLLERTSIVPDAAVPAQELGQLLELAINAALQRNYTAALSAFREAHRLSPGDRLVEFNLRRLQELGHEVWPDRASG